MNTKFYIIFLSFVITIQLCLGQIPIAPVSVKTPNAASLGLYGEVPVSKFTGVPDINIPIHELTKGKVSVPISLSYHASGFRPDAHPGWVGMGWNLFAGGAISRSVNDQPDDYSNRNYGNDIPIEAGFFYNYKSASMDTWNHIDFLKLLATSKNTLKDTQPDEFSFNVNGISGKFYLDHNGKWKVQCDRGVEVTFNNEFIDCPFPDALARSVGNSKSFAGFTITDEFGNQYVFGGNNSAIDYSVDFFLQSVAEWRADTWYLTKIINSTGGVVNFNYQRDDLINEMYNSVHNTLRASYAGAGFSCESPNMQSQENSAGKLSSPVYLKNILTDGYEILFKRSTTTELRYPQEIYSIAYRSWYGGDVTSNYPFLFVVERNKPQGTDNVGYPELLKNLQWKKLDEIQVISDDVLLKKMKFIYNNNPTERLTLLTIIEEGPGTSQVSEAKRHDFYYDTSAPLPGYLGYKVDHWGFYNGIELPLNFLNIGSIDNYKNYYNYREAKEAFLYAGALKKIKYPTGGTTVFTYEPHRYQKRLNRDRSDGIDQSYHANTIAGGLRIKKVTSYTDDEITEANTKEYFYVTGFSNKTNHLTLPSSGILNAQIQYYFDDYRLEVKPGKFIIKEVFSTQSVLPGTTNSKGAHIGYSEVVERSKDKGYIKSIFSNFDSGHIDERAVALQDSRASYNPYSAIEQERGVLLSEEFVRNDDVPIKKDEWKYTATDKENQFVRSIFGHTYVPCYGFQDAVSEGHAIKYYTYSYLPTKHIQTIYSKSGDITTIQNTVYDNQTKLKKTEEVLNSKGERMLSNFYYPEDQASSGLNTTYSEMKRRNMIGYITKKEERLNDVLTKITTNHYAEYWAPNGNLILPSSIWSKTGNLPEEEILRFTVYDRYGNLSEHMKPGGPKTSYVWNGEYLIAKVENVSQNELSMGSAGVKDRAKYGKIESSVPLQYSIANGPAGKYALILESQDGLMYTNGINLKPEQTYIFSYWEKGALLNLMTYNTNIQILTNQIVKTQDGWNLREIKFKGGSGELEFHFDYRGRVQDMKIYPEEAQLSLFSYQYGLLTSQTDPRGLTTYFEYDGLQRLKYIRDNNLNIIRSFNYNYKR